MHQTINDLTLAEMKKIIDGSPKFIRESISQDETMFNPRTQKYIERGTTRALIQLDEGSDEYFYSTMPEHSSFYSECYLLNDIRDQIKLREKA